jgi:hypothetical protein
MEVELWQVLRLLPQIYNPPTVRKITVTIEGYIGYVLQALYILLAERKTRDTEHNGNMHSTNLICSLCVYHSGIPSHGTSEEG